MIGAREIMVGARKLVQNSNVLLHLDNMNAAIIFSKGSF